MDRTPNTCRYSKDGRSDKEASSIQNKGSLDIIMYHDIFMEAKDRGWVYNLTMYKIPHTGGKFNRILQVTELERYHTETLGLSARKNLPLLCPPRSELQSLLDKSWRFEELVVPGFFATNLGREEHIRTFWSSVDEKKPYCWLDVQRLFQ